MLRRVRQAFDPDGGGCLGLAARTVQRYVADGMAERAPALAYYGMFSLFPALMLAFAVTRFLAGDGAPADVAEYSREHGASGAVAGALRSAVQTAQEASVPTAGSAGVASLLTLVYGASRAFTAIGRAVDAIGRRTYQPRSLLKRAQDIGWTLVLLAMGIIALLLVTVSGRVLEELVSLFGIDGTDPTIWSVVRWPLAACLALIAVDLVRWTAPTARRGPFRLMTAGRLFTVAALVMATVGYNVYITHIASYNATYGAFAAAIILMLWIWLAGSVLLIGAELDAVLDERAGRRSARQPSTSPTSRARATASERDDASSLR
jgi:membrane protein